MADSIQWIQHVELYVSSSATPSQQVASVDAVATLLKNDLLTLEALVREMCILTTTDSISALELGTLCSCLGGISFHYGNQ
ncbi:UNVERIFIED_CONTAM: hypothetical protein Slati_3349700 [Sesamum latifolium]|uniref:Uncharacterized protein n=1 Tax=Sesamum latifolium TaxID=2727402 RepID=A0AAW2UEI1_9LAMI